MAADREGALEVALTALRDRLRHGAYAPGARIPATALAASLRISATPVREALCRLVGEGVVEERRSQGFFVRSLTGVDVADLHRFALALLLVLAGRGRGPQPAPPAEGDLRDPVGQVEDLLAGWVAATGGPALIRTHQAIATQLGPVRRVEPRVFDDLEAEAAGLFRAAASPDVADFVQALRRFHGRRVQAADRLAAALISAGKYRGHIV